MNRLILLLFVSFVMASCNKPTKDDEQQSEDSVAMEEPSKPELTMTWETDTVLTTNESVLYYPAGEILYVSNISGTPTDKDGIGYISRLKPDGTIDSLKWVTGLNAPKGMAILNDKLYVTDIDQLVEINLADGKITNSFPVEGAEFLNDVATDGTNIYFSDMKKGKIHVLEDGNVKVFKDSVQNINGLAFNEGELFGLDANGLRKYTTDGAELINGAVTGGDGLVIINDSTFVASRWQGEIYLIQGGKEHLLLDTKDQKSNTADIGYIPGQQMVLVPTFFKNKVVAYKLTY